MKKENVVVKQNCHSRMSLSGISRVLSRYAYKVKTLFINNPDVEDPRQNSSGMTTLLITAQRAFTLIELLVVVLIIGILAAVAVPQYQKAVMHTRFIKLYNLAKNYERAADEYIVANGEWPGDFKDLSIDAPGGFEQKSVTGGECVQNNELYCCIKSYVEIYQNSGITCARKDYSIAYSYVFNGAGAFRDKTSFCIAQKDDIAANKVCSSYNNTVWSSAFNLVTPTGHSTLGYKYYQMP